MAKATAAGDEAVSNIRTVRAFAMEDEEMEVYGTELSRARQLNENLGMGIGLFQVQKTRSWNHVTLFLMSEFQPGRDQSLPQRHRANDPLLRGLPPLDVEPLSWRTDVVPRRDTNHAAVHRANVASIRKFCQR